MVCPTPYSYPVVTSALRNPGSRIHRSSDAFGTLGPLEDSTECKLVMSTFWTWRCISLTDRFTPICDVDDSSEIERHNSVSEIYTDFGHRCNNIAYTKCARGYLSVSAHCRRHTMTLNNRSIILVNIVSGFRTGLSMISSQSKVGASRSTREVHRHIQKVDITSLRDHNVVCFFQCPKIDDFGQVL